MMKWVWCSVKDVNDEDPEIGLGVFDLILLMGPPTCGGQFALQEESALSRVEVLGELDLERDGARIVGVGDQKVYARVLRGNPHVQFRIVFLDERPNEVLTSMDCE